MTLARQRTALAAALLAPLAVFPLLLRPELGIAAAAAAAAVLLAARSVAYPIALAGLPTVLFGLFGAPEIGRGAVTIGFAAWAVLAMFLVTLRNRDAPPVAVLTAAPVILTVVLVGVLLWRLGDSPSDEYGSLKMQLFVAGNLVFGVGGVFVGWRNRHFELLVRLMLAVATAGALVLIYQLSTGQEVGAIPGRFSVSAEDDPITLGRNAAAGLLLAAYLALTASVGVRLWATATLPALAVALLASGSRGPVLGVGIGLLVLLALSLGTAAARRRVALVVTGALVAAIVVPLIVPGSTVSRSLSVVAASGTDLSSNGRLDLWSDAWDEISQRPLLGLGTGGFAAVRPDEGYPHNVFLEAATDAGVVGLLLVVAFVVAAGGRLAVAWRRAAARDRMAVAAVMALFVTAVVNAQFSGGLPNNRAVWLWAGVAVGLAGRLAHGAPREDREPGDTAPARAG